MMASPRHSRRQDGKMLQVEQAHAAILTCMPLPQDTKPEAIDAGAVPTSARKVALRESAPPTALCEP